MKSATPRICGICKQPIHEPRIKTHRGECARERDRRVNRERMALLRKCDVSQYNYTPLDTLIVDTCFAGGDPKRAKAWLGLRDEVTKGCKRDGRVKYPITSPNLLSRERHEMP